MIQQFFFRVYAKKKEKQVLNKTHIHSGIIYNKEKVDLGAVAHICKPKDLGSWGRRFLSSRPASKTQQDPVSK